MRRPHWIRPNRLSRAPVTLAVFDTETDSITRSSSVIEQRLRFGWGLLVRRTGPTTWSAPVWHRFQVGSDWWRWLTDHVRDHERVVVVGHNVGFDLRTSDAFAVLPSLGWRLEWACIDDPPTILRYRGPGRRRLLIIDTLNYWRVPLATIGESLGLPKLDHDLAWGDQERDDTYCRRDVEIVWAAMRRLVETITTEDIGDWAPTAAGLAWHTWRHRHMSARVFVDDNEPGLDLARRAYYGGRCEPWRVGDVPGPVYHVDVTSMYPSVMHDEVFPVRHLSTIRGLSVDEVREPWPGRTLIAEVEIETPDPIYPLRRGREVVWPVGRFPTVLAEPELRMAANRGHLRRIMRAAIYEARPLFRSYVAEWWERRMAARLAGDAMAESLAKLLLNSLSGKFAQRGRRWVPVREIDPSIIGQWEGVDLDTGEHVTWRAFGGLLARLVEEGESRDSVPAISAMITSAGRARLWHAVEWVGQEHVVYLDTDTLFLTEEGYRRLAPIVEERTLGAWRLVATYDWVEILGAKDYVANGRWVCKGRSLRSWPLSPDEAEVEVWERLPEAVQRGDLDSPLIHRLRWRRRKAWTGRETYGDGSTRPYRLSIVGG